MIEFGKTLKEAREARGLTISQIAEKTHMMSSLIQNLEDEDLSKIAAPIYGRGFVRLYCEAVGLEPQPLVTEFMEILNGNREVGIKERPVASSPASANTRAERNAPLPDEEPAPVHAEEPPPAAKSLPQMEEPSAPSLPEPFRLVGERAPAAPLPSLPETNQTAPSSDFAEPKPVYSKYAAPFGESKDPRRHLPRLMIPSFVWRLGLLAVLALVLLVGVGLGLRALYRATSASKQPVSSPAAIAERAPARTPEKTEARAKAKPATKAPAAPRKPGKVKPLYID